MRDIVSLSFGVSMVNTAASGHTWLLVYQGPDRLRYNTIQYYTILHAGQQW